MKLRNEAIKAGRKSIEGGKQARKAFQQAVKAAREADDDDPAQAAFGWVMYFQSPNVYNFNIVNLLNSLRNHHNIEYFLSDSGSTHHILNNEKHFVGPLQDANYECTVGGGGLVKVNKIGTARIKCHRTGQIIQLNECLFMPDCPFCIIAEDRLCQKDKTAQILG